MKLQSGVSRVGTELEAAGIRTQYGEMLSGHTTFRIGGPASLAVFPQDAEELIRAVRFCREAELPYLLLGCGSDVLADDGGYAGAVIFTTEMKRISVCGETLTAEAGTPLSLCACAARDASLAGMAFAYGIPGSVGGGVFMNAGAYGGEIVQILSSVDCYDAEEDRRFTLSAAECALGYRTSVFQKTGYIILRASFALHGGDREAIRAEMNDYMARRREKQPLEYPSAGSVFKRPTGYYAGTLIQEAGLKGCRIGGAQVSEKHAGFIVNVGGATAQDVQQLIARIQQTVEEKYGVRLEPEVKFVG